MGARILVVDDSPTIRKVVARILERHNYEAIPASDGLEALELLRTESADLMLVDFVMPRMNGYQLCLSVRQDQQLRDLPVILMSAKGDKIRGRFVQQTGALDAITKPFDARGLIAVVESALAKAGGGAREPSSDDFHSSPDAVGDSLGTLSQRATLELGERLADLLSSSLGSRATPPGRDDIARAFVHALSPGGVGELAADILALDIGAMSGEILSGDFGSISIAEILQLLQVQQKTGALTLHHKKKKVTLFMRHGVLDFASYTGLPEEFLLGRYLADVGGLPRTELEKYIDGSRKAGRLIGDYLVQLGVISEGTLTLALRRQTSELLYEVVRWRTGRFRFVEREEQQLGARARLGLQTIGLVMEGFRRVDEWRLIEDSFDFSDVLFRDDLAITQFDTDEELTHDERRMLSAVDGEATVGDLLDRFGGGSFENCKIVYRLLNSRLVRRKSQ